MPTKMYLPDYNVLCEVLMDLILYRKEKAKGENEMTINEHRGRDRVKRC